ncbi:MAG: diacylglycerol kinase family lipid kinase [Prolixibacteraceae bacterium]|nr:diacylglycerol kinase family lipid kinase [Prolixibacteraceae bacterium]
MGETRWQVILNPNAGGRQAEKDWPMIKEELLKEGFNFETELTQHPLHAIQLVTQKIKEGYRKFIVIGGDGTLHEIANGIMSQNFAKPDEILLAMISVGTGNDWIKTHQISPNYIEAIQQIKTGNTIKQDVGKIVYKNGSPEPEIRYFINSVGIGFDARVVKYILPRKLKGKSNKSDYIKGLIRSLFTNKNIKSLLQIDNEKVETKIYNLTVGLCKFKGGGFKLLPNAIPDDGELDITLASRISKRKLIASLPKIFGGRVEQIKYFDFFRVKELILDISKPVCTEADGEFLGHYPLQVSIIPNQLNIISNYNPAK